MAKLLVSVLVCGLGLTSGEAWAQQPTPPTINATSTVDLHELEEQDNLRLKERDSIRANSRGFWRNKFGYYLKSYEQVPAYKDDIQQFFDRNRRWPADADVSLLEIRVLVYFVVDEQGRVRDVRVVRGFTPAFDAEALRLVNLLDGRFTPAKVNGRPAPFEHTIAVVLRRYER